MTIFCCSSASLHDIHLILLNCPCVVLGCVHMTLQYSPSSFDASQSFDPTGGFTDHHQHYSDGDGNLIPLQSSVFPEKLAPTFERLGGEPVIAFQSNPRAWEMRDGELLPAKKEMTTGPVHIRPTLRRQNGEPTGISHISCVPTEPTRRMFRRLLSTSPTPADCSMRFGEADLDPARRRETTASAVCRTDGTDGRS